MALAVGVPGAAETGVMAGRGGKDVAHLRPLTGLRFMAALLVVIHHYFGIATGDYGQRADPRVPPLIAAAFVGVNFFFILSGFILAYNYLGAGGRLRGTRRHFWAASFIYSPPFAFVCCWRAVACLGGRCSFVLCTTRSSWIIW